MAKADDTVDERGYSSTVRKVLVVNSSGVPIKSTQLEENRSGADSPGTDGTTSRVLTLQNTSTSGAPIAVWVDSTLIALADMTITHNSAASTILFDSVAIYDAQSIRVTYYV